MANEAKSTALVSVKNTAELVRQALPSIRQALPRNVDPERYAQIILTLVQTSPSLLACERGSFVLAVLQCASLGLNPALGEAHLIPRKNNKKGGITEANFQIDFKGLNRLALRSGRYSHMDARVVHAGDTFEYEFGLTPKLRHVPGDNDAGEITYAYAIAWPANGEGLPQWEVMTRREIDGIRARSRSATSGPWVTDFAEMCRKTPFRRLAKWLELSPEAVIAIQADDLEAAGRSEEASRLLDGLRGGELLEPVQETQGDEGTEGADGGEAGLRAKLEASLKATAKPKAGEPAEPSGGRGSEELPREFTAEDARALIEQHVDWKDEAWLGALPLVRELPAVLAELTNVRVIGHMAERNTYVRAASMYAGRLAELGAEAPILSDGSAEPGEVSRTEVEEAEEAPKAGGDVHRNLPFARMPSW